MAPGVVTGRQSRAGQHWQAGRAGQDRAALAGRQSKGAISAGRDREGIK